MASLSGHAHVNVTEAEVSKHIHVFRVPVVVFSLDNCDRPTKCRDLSYVRETMIQCNHGGMIYRTDNKIVRTRVRLKVISPIFEDFL